jgi:hypothetical protein
MFLSGYKKEQARMHFIHNNDHFSHDAALVTDHSCRTMTKVVRRVGNMSSNRVHVADTLDCSRSLAMKKINPI